MVLAKFRQLIKKHSKLGIPEKYLRLFLVVVQRELALGLDSVPKGQWEACKALNLSMPRTYFRVVIPQAVPPALPGMGNYLVGIFKDTPMLSVIGVAELMHTAGAVGSQSYRYLEPYTMVGLIFLAISLPTAFGLRRLEAWVARRLGVRK